MAKDSTGPNWTARIIIIAFATVLAGAGALWLYDKASREIATLVDKVSRGIANTETCEKAGGDEAIAACTWVIDSGHLHGHDLAVEYYNRGIEYKHKGDFDRAIADYGEAIRLDPGYQHAYVNRGLAYDAKGDVDRAIADYTEAIRLDPKDKDPYTNRGGAYHAKGDLDRAIADHSEAIRLDPTFAAAYVNRGNAYRAKDDLDRAIADYDQAIRLDPKKLSAYLSRGRANLYAGALATALADFEQANARHPKDAYAALWRDIADTRSHRPSRLADAAARIDMTQWPAPVIRLYLGQMTPEAVLAAADNPDADTKNGRMCEANFYTGELQLQQGKTDDATRLFRLAAASCPKGFVEFDGATAELKALGAAQ